MDHQFHPVSPLAAATSQPFTPMSVLSMQQLHQQTQTRSSPHILPPLQPQQTSIGLPHQIYGQSGSSPHTPQTPNTPHTPISAGGNGSFSHMAQQQSPYLQSPQSFSSPTSLISPVSVTHSQSMALSPAHDRQPVPLRPMPSGGLSQMSQMRSQYAHSRTLSQSSVILNQEVQPTHVVGSQGRRGILPSAPGRAAAVTGSGGPKNGLIPVKDADGKFPCPHCNKSYLHAKHLKRHLLRHTGDRPYMCVLCKDTFSRSDILKRHFQKCSLRRGNPTGATHLSHSHAYHKKSRSTSYKATTPGSDISPTDDTKIIRNGSSSSLMASSPPKYTDEQRAVSTSLCRKNSIKRSNSSEGIRDSRVLPGHGPSIPHRGSMDIGHNERLVSALSSVMDSSISAFAVGGPTQPQFANGFDFTSQGPGPTSHQGSDPRDHGSLGHMSHGSNRESLPYFNGPQNQTSEVDWPSLFQTGSHDTLINPMLQSNMSHGHMPIKSEPPLENGSYEPTTESHDGVFNNLY